MGVRQPSTRKAPILLARLCSLPCRSRLGTPHEALVPSRNLSSRSAALARGICCRDVHNNSRSLTRTFKLWDQRQRRCGFGMTVLFRTGVSFSEMRVFKRGADDPLLFLAAVLMNCHPEAPLLREGSAVWTFTTTADPSPAIQIVGSTPASLRVRDDSFSRSRRGSWYFHIGSLLRVRSSRFSNETDISTATRSLLDLQSVIRQMCCSGR